MKKLIFIAVIFLFGCSNKDSLIPLPTQQPSLYMALSKASIQFAAAGGEGILEVESTYPWSAELAEPGNASWLSFTPNSGGSGKTTIRITALSNAGNTTNRTATIRFSIENQTASFTVSQNTFGPSGYYADGDVLRLQSATAATGRGIELVIMGDGFTAADMAKGGGRYETLMRETMEHFFSTYPYSAHRNRFNVWMVAAVSNESGVSVQTPPRGVDNVFKSVWEGGESTGVDCDESVVTRYASLVSVLSGKPLSQLTVILPLNLNIDAGTTVMQYEGFSYALCPTGPMYKNIVVHEAGGHGFAKLGDEYAYNEMVVPPYRVSDIRMAKEQYGWYENLDFSSDITQTSWRVFAGLPKYSMVGTFEGGSSYTRGIWRPEANSVMIGGVLYFNAPSRWAQMRRMNELEGTPYTFAQFLADDVVPTVPPETPRPTRFGGTMKHHAPPIVVMPE